MNSVVRANEEARLSREHSEMDWHQELVCYSTVRICEERERKSTKFFLEFRMRFTRSLANSDDFTASRNEQVMLLFEGQTPALACWRAVLGIEEENSP